MVNVNPANILNMLILLFHISSIPETPVNHKEIELRDAISDIIRNAIDDVSYDIQTDVTLEFEDNFDNESDLPDPELVTDNEIEADNEDDDEDDNEDDNEVEDSCISENNMINYDYKTRAVEFWKSGKRGHYSFSTVKKNFKKVKSLQQLYRWEYSLQKGGTNREKLLYISAYVLTKFKAANDENKIIHDLDLRRWALEAKECIDLTSFKAGATWILNFKRKHGIVSRKITKFINRSIKVDKEKLIIACQEFVATVKSDINVFGIENIYNADESGFNLEIHSGRTLTTKGAKTVDSLVQSQSAITHSYTIMYAYNFCKWDIAIASLFGIERSKWKF